MKKIFGNNIILKLTFASLTAFLLFEEFYVFFIVKPTYTTSAKLQIGLKILHPSVVGMQIINVTGPDDYPDITLCPFPSYNQPNLLNHGYGHSFEYAKVSILFIVVWYLFYCEAQGKGRAKGRLRKLIVDCRYQLSIIDIDFPEALH